MSRVTGTHPHLMLIVRMCALVMGVLCHERQTSCPYAIGVNMDAMGVGTEQRYTVLED